ncbi:MAG: hypothetical protein Q9187_004295, partial [Circinaria calcarea]
DDAKAPTTKLLTKWRPHILEDKSAVNGVQQDTKEQSSTPIPLSTSTPAPGMRAVASPPSVAATG